MQTFQEWMEAHVRGTVTGDPRDVQWELDRPAKHAQVEDEQARRDAWVDRFVEDAKRFADHLRQPNFAADVVAARQQIKDIKSSVEIITEMAQKEIDYIVDAFHTMDSQKKGLEHPRFFKQRR